jgi:hypothetical protein
LSNLDTNTKGQEKKRKTKKSHHSSGINFGIDDLIKAEGYSNPDEARRDNRILTARKRTAEIIDKTPDEVRAGLLQGDPAITAVYEPIAKSLGVM